MGLMEYGGACLVYLPQPRIVVARTLLACSLSLERLPPSAAWRPIDRPQFSRILILRRGYGYLESGSATFVENRRPAPTAGGKREGLRDVHARSRRECRDME